MLCPVSIHGSVAAALARKVGLGGGKAEGGCTPLAPPSSAAPTPPRRRARTTRRRPDAPHPSPAQAVCGSGGCRALGSPRRSKAPPPTPAGHGGAASGGGGQATGGATRACRARLLEGVPVGRKRGAQSMPSSALSHRCGEGEGRDGGGVSCEQAWESKFSSPAPPSPKWACPARHPPHVDLKAVQILDE